MCLNFVEAGFDPPAKLVCWLHDPFERTHSLIRCGIRRYVQEPLHLPYWGAACLLQTQKKTYLTRVLPLVSSFAWHVLSCGLRGTHIFTLLFHLWDCKFVHIFIYSSFFACIIRFAALYLYIGVTLPGTNVGVSALTRGKPTFPCCFFLAFEVFLHGAPAHPYRSDWQGLCR